MLPEKERKRRRSKSWVQDVSKFCRMFLEPVCLKELLLIKFISKKDSSGSFYLSRCRVQTLHAQMEDWFDLGFQLWHFGVCSRCSVLESSGFYLFFGFKVFAWPSVDLALTKKQFPHCVLFFTVKDEACGHSSLSSDCNRNHKALNYTNLPVFIFSVSYKSEESNMWLGDQN